MSPHDGYCAYPLEGGLDGSPLCSSEGFDFTQGRPAKTIVSTIGVSTFMYLESVFKLDLVFAVSLLQIVSPTTNQNGQTSNI